MRKTELLGIVRSEIVAVKRDKLFGFRGFIFLVGMLLYILE